MFFGAFFFCSASYFLSSQIQSVFKNQDVDSKAYLANAKLFYKNNSFAWSGTAYKKYPYYTLGYSFIIAMLFKLFGDHNIVIILFQVLLSLLSAILIFDIARKIAGNFSGVIAYLFVCFNLGFLTFSQFILTEVVLSFFLILFFNRFFYFLSNKDDFILAQAAFALGLSVLIKPAAIYFWPLLLPCFLVKEKKVIFSFVRRSMVWGFAFYLPLAGYALHNKVIFDRWYVCALDQENMIYWFFPNVLAAQNNSDQNTEREKLRSIPHEVAQEKFFTTLLQRPFLFGAVWLKNVLKTWVGLFVTNLKVLIEPGVNGGDISFFKTSGTLISRINSYVQVGTQRYWIILLGYYELLWSITRFVLFFVGIGVMIAWHKIIESYTIMIFLAYFSLITGHDGCARFRMMFEWLLLIMASIGLCFILSKLLKHACSKIKQCT